MRRRQRFPSSQEDNSESQERWLLTYADMITLLLGLFIILYAVSKVDAKRMSDVAKEIRKGFGLKVSSIGTVLDGGSGLLEEDILEPKSQVFRLWERIGYALKELKEKAKLKLGLAETEELKLTFLGSDLTSKESLESDEDLDFAFRQLAQLSKDMDIEMVVRVHVPYETNVDLSKFKNAWDSHAHRASILAERLVGQYGISKEKISIQGYSTFQREGETDTPEKKAQQERIEILIRKKESVVK